jgi:hypothetical protein
MRKKKRLMTATEWKRMKLVCRDGDDDYAAPVANGGDEAHGVQQMIRASTAMTRYGRMGRPLPWLFERNLVTYQSLRIMLDVQSYLNILSDLSHQHRVRSSRNRLCRAFGE